jgi:hypothetical protein
MTDALDFSDFSDLIPTGTIAVLQMRLRPTDGTNGVLKRTKDGTAEGLDAEYVLIDGPHAKRKLFSFVLVSGETDGQKQMADRNKALLKRVIDSAKFLDPTDMSPEARAKRTMPYRDLDGLRFLGEVGVEAGKNGFPDKNVVLRAITKDRQEWGGRPPIDQIAPDFSAGGPAPAAPPAAAPIVKPKWAQ